MNNYTSSLAQQTSQSAIPTPMQEANRWVVQRNKTPFNARTGKRASSTDPKTWSSFPEACKALDSGQYAGLGFTLADDWAGVDLDHVRDATTGVLTPWAAWVLGVFKGRAYIEASYSGTGAHIMGRGHKPDGECKALIVNHGSKDTNEKLEMYDHGRYLTVSAQQLPGSAAPTDCTEELALLHEVATKGTLARIDDAFMSLWNGDTTQYDNDDSGADLALCNLLAYLCNGDYDTMDALFRRSGLMRDKWDEMRGVEPYGAITLGKALASYKPASSAAGGRVGQEGARDVEAAALALAEAYSDKLGYDYAALCWRLYGGGAWKACSPDSPLLRGLVVDALTTAEVNRNPRTVRETLDMAQRHMGRDFRARGGLVAFSNGTYDAATGLLRPHSADDNLTHSLPFAYEPGGSRARVDKDIAGIIPDAVARDAYAVHTGMSLLQDTSFHHAPILLGPPATGKTTLLRWYNATLGLDANHMAEGTLFERAHEGQLQRAQCRDWPGVALDEFPSDALKNEEMLKAMTAHSGVTSRTHYSAPVTGQWKPKLLIAANDVPLFSDRTGAVARRLLVIPCPNPLAPADMDRNLLDAWEPEKGAWAAYCLDRAAAASKANAYPVSADMLKAYRDMATEGDAMKAFVDEMCLLTVDDGQAHTAPSSALFQEWQQWCEVNGVRLHWSHIKLSKQLRNYAPWHIGSGRDRANKLLTGIALKSGHGSFQAANVLTLRAGRAGNSAVVVDLLRRP